MLKYSVLFLICIFCVTVNAESNYDDLFINNKYTIYTDKNITNVGDMNDVIRDLMSSYYKQEYYNSYDDYSNLYIYLNSCSFDNSTCDFNVIRGIYKDGNYTNEQVKSYKNIEIEFENVNDDYFPFVNNEGNIVINYDESFFDDNSTKQNYISNYINSKQKYNNDDGTSVRYSYNSYSKLLKYIFVDENGNINKVHLKNINDVIFDYSETEYSEAFKNLTNGTITIKSDTPITKNILTQYISIKSSLGSFSINGDIKNDTVLISYKESYDSEISETHKVTLIRDNNIDIDTFELYGFGNYLDIKTNPTNKSYNYLSAYLNVLLYSKDLGNGNALYFNKIYSTDSDDVIICLEDTSDYYEIKNDIQFHKLTARYVGYDDTVSEDFANEIGSNITVFSSERDRFIIESAISNYKFTVLGCNSDYTKCDIAYSNYEDNNIEIHSIDIIYDENVSDYFKKIININDDDTIDIYVDEGIDTISNYYFSTYDEKSGDYLNYSCNYTNCLINYQNDFSRKRETHRVNYNLIESEPSQYYLDKVKLSTNIYLGENNYTIKQLELTPYFKINNDDYGINNHGCNNTTKKCIISLLSVNHNVELHYGSVVLKDGISDRFKSLIPDNKIKLNAVYHNDSEYLYGVSRVFFDRAKDWVYMDTYNETTKKGVVAYDIEKHSVDVEFVKGDTDKQKIIDDTITLFGQIEKKINLYDMDFVNHVYYNEGRSRYVNINFNSKQLYDYFKSVVDNKHITYYYAPYGGGGDVFCEGNVGQLILFYDGVAYGVANNPISTWVQNIIFVPDETEDTTDAYIEAALKRINKYFGKDVGMNIEFNQMMPEETSQFEYYGINNFDGKVYTLSYKGSEYNIAIVKDTSKITNSSFTAFDINNNVIITSDNVNYPTDTVVQSDIIDENSEAYKAILKKLNIKHAKIIDINLYSYIIGLIKEFKNNTFNVSLPIDTNEFDINNLYAYYIDDKGNLEEHKVTIDDFMASFETTHFSTYIITEKIDDANKNDIKDVKKIIDENINNSNTGDTINYSFISLGVSSLILIVSTILIVLLKKKKVHR